MNKITMYRLSRPALFSFIALFLSCLSVTSPHSSRSAFGANDHPESTFWGFGNEVEILNERVRTASPGIVLITVYDNTGEKTDSASGFFVDRKGRIITNAKVVRDAYSATVKSNSHQYDNVTILSMDKENDIALVKVRAIDETPLEMDTGYELTVDEKVLMVGKSENLKDTVAEGTVTEIVDNGETAERIEIKKTIPITYFPDNKDGPVLNREGKVIGIQTVILGHPVFGKDAIQLDDKKVSAVSVKSIYSLLSGQNIVELHQAGSTEIFAVLKKHLTTAFIVFYGIGLPKLIGIIFVSVVIISALQWCYMRLRNKFKRDT